MNDVESVERKLQCIRPDELERVMRLIDDIDAHDVESGAVVADRRTASSAKQVK